MYEHRTALARSGCHWEKTLNCSQTLCWCGGSIGEHAVGVYWTASTTSSHCSTGVWKSPEFARLGTMAKLCWVYMFVDTNERFKDIVCEHTLMTLNKSRLRSKMTDSHLHMYFESPLQDLYLTWQHFFSPRPSIIVSTVIFTAKWNLIVIILLYIHVYSKKCLKLSH